MITRSWTRVKRFESARRLSFLCHLQVKQRKIKTPASYHRFYTTARGVLPRSRSEITPQLPETFRGVIRQHLNTHLIGAGREVFAHPLVYVALGSPGHQSFREPIAAVPREVLFAEAGGASCCGSLAAACNGSGGKGQP